MGLYSMALKLENKCVVVIGGGKVATRKIKSLLEVGATVHVISPIVTPAIIEWANENKLNLVKRPYHYSDIKEAFLIIAATNNKDVNLQVLHDKKNHQLINLVDFPEKSDFFVPAVIKRGKLILTVSTSGASPGLAKKIKQEISTLYDPAYDEYVTFLEECRHYVMEHILEEKKRKKVFNYLLDSSFLTLTKNKNVEKRRELFLSYVDKVKKAVE